MVAKARPGREGRDEDTIKNYKTEAEAVGACANCRKPVFLVHDDDVSDGAGRLCHSCVQRALHGMRRVAWGWTAGAKSGEFPDAEARIASYVHAVCGESRSRFDVRGELVVRVVAYKRRHPHAKWATVFMAVPNPYKGWASFRGAIVREIKKQNHALPLPIGARVVDSQQSRKESA